MVVIRAVLYQFFSWLYVSFSTKSAPYKREETHYKEVTKLLIIENLGLDNTGRVWHHQRDFPNEFLVGVWIVWLYD